MQLPDGSLPISSSLGLQRGQIMDLSNEAWEVMLFLAQRTHAEASAIDTSPWLS